MKLVRSLTLALSALALAGLLYVFARRLLYPYDLEWMEGGMLCHALRLLEHKPLYTPPSVDFVPFLYTPLYPALLALVSKIAGLTYGLARGLSIVSFLAALCAGYVFVRREGGSSTAALAAVAIPAAAFVPTGAWYDLARPDSLSLALVTIAVVVGWRARGQPADGSSAASHLRAVLAAALMVAAFFAKQTAAPFMVALGLALCVARWRVALTYGASVALLGLPLLLWANHASGGWFWRYVFELHQQHSFRPIRGFLAAPGLLLLILGPSLLLLVWGLLRRRTPALAYSAWIGLVGLLVSCISYGTLWSFANAIIPGVFFLALAAGTAAGRLLDGNKAGGAGGRPPLVLGLLALTLLLFAPNGAARLLLPVVPASWKMGPRALTGYDPRPFLPAGADREAGARLVERLRQAPGEVLIPGHPFYAHLAGKRVYLHRMGVLDVVQAGRPAPEGLALALATRRFSLVVMNDDEDWASWPGLLQSYRLSDEKLAGPRAITGTPTEPRHVLLPR
jgi:xanthosine utilization system XapX-like protein